MSALNRERDVKRFHVFLLAVVFSAFFLQPATSANAQSVGEQVTADVRAISAWSSQMQGVYTLYLHAVAMNAEIEILAVELMAEELDLGEAEKRYQMARADVEEALAAADLAYSALPAPPVLVQLHKFSEVLVNNRVYIDQIKEGAPNDLIRSDQLFQLAVNGDPAAFVAIFLSGLDRSARAIEGETRFIEMNRTIVSHSHPQHSLIGSIIAQNRALAHSLRLQMSLLQGELDAAVFSDQLVTSRQHLQIARSEIERGRAAVEPFKLTMKSQLQQLDGSSEAIAMYATLETMLEMYPAALDNEEAIIAVIDKLCDLLAEDPLLETREAEFNDTYADLERLIQTRLALEQQRLAVAASM